MRRWWGGALAALVLALVSFPASAQTPTQSRTRDFAAWLSGVREEARAKGIGPAGVAALDGVKPIEQVLAFDRRQPEFTLSFTGYIAHIVTPARLKRGRTLMAQHRALLAAVSKRYHVPGRFVVALWGIESDFGRATGGFPVVAALATLAYDGRRSAYFRGELLQALRIADGGAVPPQAMTGSWAGAMGQCQFMPSTYRKWAQSWNGDGRPDIWRRTADVFASTANYLAGIGWDEHLTWGRKIRLPPHIDKSLFGLGTRRTLKEWSRLGVRRADGGPLPERDVPASLVRAETGKGGDVGKGPPYLVYDNFRVLMQWNRSVFFAIAAGTLADRLSSR